MASTDDHHLLQYVARWGLGIDDDDVGLNCSDPLVQIGGRGFLGNNFVAGGDQRFLQQTDILWGVVHQHDPQHLDDPVPRGK